MTLIYLLMSNSELVTWTASLRHYMGWESLLALPPSETEDNLDEEIGRKKNHTNLEESVVP